MPKGRSRRYPEFNKYLDEVRASFSEIHNTLVRDKKVINPIVMRDLFISKVEKQKMLCLKIATTLCFIVLSPFFSYSRIF